MKIFFKTRSAARSFASSSARKVTDLGTTSQIGKRWAVACK